MTVMRNEDPADPSVHEPRVTDAPEAVWLVYGDLDRDSTHRECCDSGEVTWCEDAQFAADVRYLRADLLYSEARQIAAQEVAAERERCIGWCRKVMEHHHVQPDCSQEPDEPTFRDGEACGAEDCIEAIQHEGDWP